MNDEEFYTIPETTAQDAEDHPYGLYARVEAAADKADALMVEPETVRLYQGMTRAQLDEILARVNDREVRATMLQRWRLANRSSELEQALSDV